MAVIDTSGLGSAFVNRPDADIQEQNRPESGRLEGGGRAAGRAGAGGGRGGTDAVVLDLSPAARAVVEAGPDAARQADPAPGANDALSRAQERGGSGPAPTDALIPSRRGGEAGETREARADSVREERAEDDRRQAESVRSRAGADAAGRRLEPAGRRLSLTV
ncbi:MAG: hypothetical protein KatS3mg119_0968 [Rhodothalassiaceae bacterium]|nr:MAG: hypothetical protein KatS3mg119_0968 [Rhodothalassiaceae bacterium]